MTFNEECVENSEEFRIVFSEAGNRIIFYNPERRPVQKIQVDGCQITQGQRCDYLLTFLSEEHFVELKGHDLRRAFNQLKRTISLLGRREVSKRVSYVICNRSPLLSPEIQVERKKFKKNYNSGLMVKTKQETIKI